MERPGRGVAAVARFTGLQFSMDLKMPENHATADAVDGWRSQLTAPNLLAALVQGWGLLLGGVVLACVVAFLVFQIGRNTSVWEVVAVFNLPETQGRQLTAPQVLEQVARSLDLPARELGAGAHDALLARISVSPVSLTRQAAFFRGNTPDAAIALAAAVVAAAPAAVALPPAQQSLLSTELKQIDLVLPDYELALRRERMLIRCVLGEEVEALPGDETPCRNEVPMANEVPPFEQVRYYASLLDNYRYLDNRRAEIIHMLRDPTENLLQVAPGTPREISEARRPVNWALAVLAGLGVGALAVYLREMLRAMRRNNPGGRYDRLLAALPRRVST